MVKYGEVSEAVKQVQKTVGADPDGDYGPETHKAVKAWLRAEALRIAITQIGVEEKPRGSNWGPQVKEYLRLAGYTDPQPWCAAFTHYCYLKASEKLGVANPHPRSGYCPTVYKGLVATTKPVPGDLFFVYNKRLGRLAHVGIVERIEVASVITLEGNTNSGGSREGYLVKRGKRLIAALKFASI